MQAGLVNKQHGNFKTMEGEEVLRPKEVSWQPSEDKAFRENNKQSKALDQCR